MAATSGGRGKTLPAPGGLFGGDLSEGDMLVAPDGLSSRDLSEGEMFVAPVGLFSGDLIEGEMFDPPDWLDLVSDGGGGRENSEESEASLCDL